MRQHFDRALAGATEQGPAARCQVLARRAVEAARLGAGANDAELLELAETSAASAKELYPLLSGQAPWNAEADAALAQVRLARGNVAGATAAAGEALQFLMDSGHEDMSLEILLPAARALLAGGPPEVQGMVRGWLQMQVSRIAQSTADEGMRVRWLRGPRGRELVELAGPMEELQVAAKPAGPAAPGVTLADDDRALLRLLTQGSTNAEMATELGIDEEAVSQRLARLLTQIGATTRAEATTMAFRGLAL
jgi:DNA-binding CsgD family transcriptional regulator